MEPVLDFEAPEELLRQHGWTRALARSILRAREDADDASQEALLAAFQHPPEKGRPIRQWLARVVRNFAYRLQRGEGRRRSREQAVAAGSSAPSDPVELFGVQQDVGRAVLRLEEPFRSTIVLHYYAALDANEIARRHGVPPATVRQRLHRARARLRADLERNYGSASALGAALSKLAADDPSRATPGSASTLGAPEMVVLLKPVAILITAACALWGGWTFWSAERRADREVSAPSVATMEPAIDGSAQGSEAVEPGDASEGGRRQHESRLADVQPPPNPAKVEQRAGGFQVAGSVVDGEGRALTGAEVLVSESDPDGESPRVVTRTDSAGRFRLESVHDRQVIVARAAGYAPSIGVWIHAVTGAEVPLRIVLDGRGMLVRGRVTDSDGRPVDGALVCVGRDARGRMFLEPDEGRQPPPAVTRTDSSGSFDLQHVPSGEQPVCVRCAGFAPYRGELRVEEGAVAELFVQLAPGGTVRGHVRSPSGEPVAGASISALSSEPLVVRPRTRSDERGEFELDGLAPGSARLVASHDGFGRAEAELELAVGQDAQWNATLDPRARIFGTLRDLDGASLAGWEVRLKRDEEEELRPTDEHGAFAFAVEPDSAWRLAVFAPGVVEGYPSLLLRDVRPSEEPLVLALPDLDATAGRIVGRVLSADGFGTGAAVVETWQWPDALWGAIPLDADGRFEIAPVRPGNIGIQVLSQRFGRVHLGEHTIEAHALLDLGTLVLEEPGSVHGALRGLPPERLAMVQVDIRRLDVDVEIGRADVTGASFRSPALQPGEYELTARGDHLVTDRRSLTILSGVDVAEDFDLVPAALRRLILKLPEPGATPWVWCFVRDSSGESRWFGDGDAADGALELRVSALPGTYRVEAFSEDGDVLTGEIEIIDRDDQSPLVLEFPRR